MKIIILLLIINMSFLLFSSNSLNNLNTILKFNNYEIDKSFERLSGGTILLRDDPANYVIYQKLEDQMREIDVLINCNEDMASYV